MIQENRSRGRRNRLSSISTARARVVVAGQTHTHEKVVRVWHVAADTEQFHKVMKLTVDVAANLSPPVSNVFVLHAQHRQAYRHRRIHADHVALFDEELTRAVAQFPHLGLGDGPACAQLRDGSALGLANTVVQRGAGIRRTCRDRSSWTSRDSGRT